MRSWREPTSSSAPPAATTSSSPLRSRSWPGVQTEYVQETSGTIVPAGTSPAGWAQAVLATRERLARVRAAQVAATIGDSFSSPVVGGSYHEVYAGLLAGA